VSCFLTLHRLSNLRRPVHYSRSPNQRLCPKWPIDQLIHSDINRSLCCLIMLSRRRFFREPLLFPTKLNVQDSRTRRHFRPQAIIRYIVIKCPLSGRFFNRTPAFPSIEREPTILSRTTKRPRKIRLRIEPYSVLDFTRLPIHIHPVHNRCLVRHRRDEALILRIRVRIRQVIARIRMSHWLAIRRAGIDPEFPVLENHWPVIDFATTRRGFDACGDEVAAACAVLFALFLRLGLPDGFLGAHEAGRRDDCDEHRESHFEDSGV
jgi:hypothetical protein